jgi:hypothetical protein
MRFAQIRYHTITTKPMNLYVGKYVGNQARGPVPSMAWKQFR